MVKKAHIVHENKKKKETNYTTPIIAAVIIIALVVIGITSNGSFYLTKKTDSNQTVTVEKDYLVYAMVNGEPLYVETIDEQWDNIPAQAKLQFPKDELITQLIQEKLLLQEAAKENIVATEADIDEFILAQLSQMGTTEEEYEEMLEAQGMSMEEVRELYSKQLTIAKLFEEKSITDINATEEEVAAYYEENKEQYYKDDQVTVKHILVMIDENFNESWAEERVAEILGQLAENNSNFCQLVSNYSSDPGSVDNCGEYTFPKGMMVPEFEEAGFAMEADEIRVVNTTFGKHIMLKVGNVEAGYLTLDDEVAPGAPSVKEVIQQTLSQEKAKEAFDSYMEELMADAEIVYVEPELVEENVTEEVEVIVEEEVIENVTEEVEIETNITENVTETVENITETVEIEANTTIENMTEEEAVEENMTEKVNITVSNSTETNASA